LITSIDGEALIIGGRSLTHWSQLRDKQSPKVEHRGDCTT